MKDLVIIGAGGLGKELCVFAKSLQRNVIGFLDDTSGKQGVEIAGVPVLGKLEDHYNFLDCDFVIAIGNPFSREKIISNLSDKVSYATLINSSVNAQVNTFQQGVVICPGATLSTNITINQHALVNMNAVISHDCYLDSFCSIAPSAVLTGSCKLEKRVEVGAGAVILPGLTVGKDSVIAAGSVLMSNLVEKHIAIGNPARILKRKEFQFE